MGIQPITILHTFQTITDNLFLQEHLMLKERKKNPHCGLIAFRSYYIYQVLILYIIYVFILNKIKNKMSFLYFFLTMKRCWIVPADQGRDS